MIAARRREKEYFSSTPDYRHLANRMGSKHLGKVMSKSTWRLLSSREFQVFSRLSTRPSLIWKLNCAVLGSPLLPMLEESCIWLWKSVVLLMESLKNILMEFDQVELKYTMSLIINFQLH